MVSETYDARFAGYATRVAFDIRLTRTMIFYLSAVAALEQCGPHEMLNYENDRSISAQASAMRRGEGLMDIWVPSMKGLGERGLVEHNAAANSRGVGDPEPTWWYRLTPAGQHVMALLRIAGLAVDFKVPANQAEPEKPRHRVPAGRG